MRKLIVLASVLISFHCAAAVINIGPNGCTLQDAIRSANADASRGQCSAGSGNDTIIAPDGWSIVLSGQLPTIQSDMTIRSASSAGMLSISGDRSTSIMKVNGSTTELVLQRVTLHSGKKNSAQAGGGAALNIDDAEVTLIDSVLEFNSVKDARGGAINVRDGELNLLRTVIENNFTELSGIGTSTAGEAIYADNSAVDLTEVYIFSNTDDDSGGTGAVVIDGGSLNMQRSLVYERLAGVVGIGADIAIISSTFEDQDLSYRHVEKLAIRDQSVVRLNHVTMAAEMTIRDSLLEATNSFFDSCYLNGTVVSVNSHNLHWRTNPYGTDCIGENMSPFMLSLDDNGGFTETRALPYNSPAINGGDPAYCETLDQRGEARGAACDIGAYEATGFADVSVDFEIDQQPPYVSGQDVQAEIVITNHGPGIANAIAVDLTTSQFTVHDINSGLCSQLPCTLNQIGIGQTIRLPLEASLGSHFQSPFNLLAEAHSTPPSVHTDPDEYLQDQNNEQTLQAAIEPGADLAVNLELISPAPYFVDQLITYRAQIENQGLQSATQVQLGLDTIGMDITQWSGCDSSNGPVCVINQMNNQQMRSVDITLRVTESLFNAVARVTADQFDINLQDNMDDQGNQGAVDDADVSVSMEMVQSPPYYSDQYVQFEIIVKTGNKPASNVRLWTEMPGAMYIGLDRCFTVPCDLGSMQANESITLYFDMFLPVAQNQSSDDSWWHRVYVEPGQVDTDPDNNEVILSESLLPAADVFARVDLLSQGPYYAGQEITYEMTIINSGVNHASALEILPQYENLTLLWASGDNCSDIDCTIGQLNFAERETLTVRMRIDQPGGFNLGVKAFAAEHDPNLSNNQDLENGDIAVLPTNDLIFKDGFERAD